MKRILSIVAVVTVAMIVACIIYPSFTPRPKLGRVNAFAILEAARSYAADLQLNGQVVPATVSLHDLMRKGLLKPEDVSGFAGMDASVLLTTNASNPQGVLMRARMQDGGQAVVLTDGSVLTSGKIKLDSDIVSANTLPLQPHD
jgi:hypothetical protein